MRRHTPTRAGELTRALIIGTLLMLSTAVAAFDLLILIRFATA